MHGKPTAADLHAAAVHANAAATALARAIGAATTAGLVVDDEITQCAATLTSWASWVTARAAAQPTKRT
jgi:hypothetical protein